MPDIIAAVDEVAATTLIHDAEATLGTLARNGSGSLGPFTASWSASASLQQGVIDLIPPNVVRVTDCELHYSLGFSFSFDLSTIIPDFCLPRVCIPTPFGDLCTPRICIDWPTITIPLNYSDMVRFTADFTLDVHLVGTDWLVDVVIVGVPALNLSAGGGDHPGGPRPGGSGSPGLDPIHRSAPRRSRPRDHLDHRHRRGDRVAWAPSCRFSWRASASTSTSSPSTSRSSRRAGPWTRRCTSTSTRSAPWSTAVAARTSSCCLSTSQPEGVRMTTLDSRRMTYLNCFGQKFSKPGTYRYRITSSSTSGLDRDARFSIDVKPAASPAKIQQHDVAVRLEGRELVADPPFVSINAGDLVVWNTPDSSIAGYLIEGEGSGLSFSSARLTREAVYTHAFGVPGTYRWRDANGGKLGGTVEVVSGETDSPESARKWLEDLASPTLIRVRGDRATPEKVQILTGQTVAWAIEEAAGISVTDASVVSEGR